MVFKREVGIVPVIAGAIIVIVITFFVTAFSANRQKEVIIQIGNGIFTANIAKTDEDRQKGLSGVKKLESDEALLMVFPESKEWGVWMKDMLIPIDIVWLNEDKIVIHAVANANPLLSDSKTFTPKKPAKYVIELPAGSIKTKSINVGSIAVFDVSFINGAK